MLMTAIYFTYYNFFIKLWFLLIFLILIEKLFKLTHDTEFKIPTLYNSKI